ncbi:HDOD domain-containing protein [Rheinheimera baltica]|uniref:HDOD domain-containing protein n=1 Tax=Rheinheimera baltica TaxID=67576 RepID=UPI00273D87A7|nr:HDOD domain-containing protein [Rheinheimera baltica]MDP5151281.1 HDOD domain-containing protein [Rheinheimera baltica]
MKHLISNATNLPSIPKVVQELIASFSNPDITSNHISQILINDQALSAKVLRMANSVRYGGHRKVGSIKDAVVMLGFNSLRTMVLSVGFTSALDGPAAFDIREFWLKSFKMANRCKWLAKTLKIDAEVAFTCGLLHAIGEYLIHVVKPAEAVVIDERVNTGESRSRLEQQLLGFDYTQAGAELTDFWHFPQEIVQAIRWQENPTGSPELSSYAACVHIAHYMVENEAKIADGNLDDFPAKLVHSMHLTLSDVFGKFENVPELDEGIEEFLN